MTNTIGTYALFQSTLSDVSNLESQLTTEQEQLSSGNAAQNFAGMADQTEQYLSLGDTIAQTTQYLTNHQVVEANVNTANSALGQIITIATNLQDLISTRTNSSTTTSAFSTQLQSIWGQLAGQLNTNVNNQYIFSGTNTSTPPVNGNTFPTTLVSGVPDDSYYSGNSQTMTARVDSNTVVTYNIPGNATGIQQIVAGLALAKEGDANNNTDQLAQAETLVQEGIQGVTADQAQTGAVASQLTTSDTTLQNSKLYWQGLQQSIGNTDIVSVSTQVAVNQGILQAAFEAFSKINSLQLSSYLTGTGG